MAPNWIQKLLYVNKSKKVSYLRGIVAGSLYRVSDIRGSTSFQDIQTQINTMRALARDSQISTALSYYATDATLTNSMGEVIWATPVDPKDKNTAEIVNQLFKRWNVTAYARDHILELATIGNLYLPSTQYFRDDTHIDSTVGVVLDDNTIKNNQYDIVPSYKIPPETLIHLYQVGEPFGYLMYADDNSNPIALPESAIIHFSLGGLLGDYTIEGRDKNGDQQQYDIKFAQPLMESAVQPTQTLSLLEDSLLLSALARTIRFISLDCGDIDENETQDVLQRLKDSIEQQFALNTQNGDAQSFVNPQSPNNLIYLPKVNRSVPIEVTTLEMGDANANDNKLLEHYQDKKLSVLGVPKEALNFSSNEGLGGAGTVLSQRSALYANSLQRLETAYMAGWRDAVNKYFISRNMSGLVDKFTLHMQPIVTTLSTVAAERRDSALSQADQISQLLKNLGIKDDNPYKKALTEILQEAFPVIGSDVMSWKIDVESAEGQDGEF